MQIYPVSSTLYYLASNKVGYRYTREELDIIRKNAILMKITIVINPDRYIVDSKFINKSELISIF